MLRSKERNGPANFITLYLQAFLSIRTIYVRLSVCSKFNNTFTTNRYIKFSTYMILNDGDTMNVHNVMKTRAPGRKERILLLTQSHIMMCY